MKIVGLIPARMASSRFPGKPLINIEGLPMIIHVLKRAQLCKKLSNIYVVTDSVEILKTVERYGGKAIMTSPIHQTGTDRIAEAIKHIDSDIIVNIQGDEPLVDPNDIERLIDEIFRDSTTQVATLVCKTPRIRDATECKVVLDLNNDILYMSREDIPSFVRAEIKKRYKLYCIIAFRRPFLMKFASWPMTPLEKVERIEYLRILEHGYKLRGVIVNKYTTSVDTPRDLGIVIKLMKKDIIKFKYLQLQTKE